MADEFGEKTEAPTDKRKKDAVEKGDILRSRDFATALSMLAGADFHAPDTPVRPGTPTTWVCAEDDTPDAILEAMAAGRTALPSLAMPSVRSPDPRRSVHRRCRRCSD